MEDNKDLLNENETLENGEENSSDALNEELEKIAQTFREELLKAQSEQAENDESEEVSSYEETGMQEEEIPEEEIPEEELCVRCGENPRDKEYGENYEYCEECREKMRRNPIGFSNILIAVLMCVMAVLSVVTFSEDFEGYYYAYKAKTLNDDKMLSSAVSFYDTAINYFESKKLTPKNLYLESAEIIFKTMPQGTASMGDVSDRISTALSGFASKLPVYKKSIDLRNESLTLYGTMEKFYGIMNDTKYLNYSIDNVEMYNSVMADVEAMIGTELSIKSIDGETAETVIINEGMVRFCQYMFAYTSERYDEANKYLEKVYELEPDYLWLYAYELGVIHIKNGELEKAQEIAEKILDNNREEADGYCIYSTVARMTGDTEKAIEWADKGLELCPEDAELLRIKAMSYVAAGDFETAKTVIDEALNYNAYGLLYYTAIVIENELGNTETVDEMLMILENGGLSLSDKMYDYFGGKITAEQMFTEGTGDVE